VNLSALDIHIGVLNMANNVTAAIRLTRDQMPLQPVVVRSSALAMTWNSVEREIG
jgi:hypothetical protein